MQQTLFGNRDLINKQHKLSTQVRMEEEAEKQQKKLKKKYTINIEYSETTTRYHKNKINVCAYDEAGMENAAYKWANDKGDYVEVSKVEILSEEYDTEEQDTKTLDMFTHENTKINTNE